MGYSSAGEARQARETLGKALQALQQDADVPEEVRGITQNVAKSIGALFEAEYASTEPDGKTCVKNALGTLSQTLALLQDVKSQHAGVQSATESIADVISILFPLTNKPSVRPESSSRRPGSQRPPASRPAASRPLTSAPPSHAPPSRRSPGSPASSNRPSASLAPSSTPSPNRPVSGRPVSGAAAAIPTSMLPPPAPIPTGPRHAVEANLGATTQSNFYVGFSGEIAHGGVFLATYEALPKDTSVRMLVTLPGGFEFECDGYIRFVRDPMDFVSESEPGMGIQFEGLSDEARDLVLRFIHKRPPIFYDV
jgi:uncharacterized protein (TIGR02266 family)